MDTDDNKFVVVPTSERELADASFYRLNDVPPELEWFANIASAQTGTTWSGCTEVQTPRSHS